MSAPRQWEELLARQEEFTCYSAAMAVWLAHAGAEWARAINPGLWLTLTDEAEGRFGFSYFPTPLRAGLGLRRTGADDLPAALDGVLAELARSGRVIVAGDGYHLPWHVAHGREHVPHWFTLTGAPDAPGIGDPFACRNELGVQTPEERAVTRDELAAMLPALPHTNPVHRLREELAFGDRSTEGLAHAHQWFVVAEVTESTAASGHDGPAAVRHLAAHFRTHGQEPDAYAQADDIWSIARHRAFLLHQAQTSEDAAASQWATEHGAQLARRWGHIAPLIMQAVLSLRAGRAASSSVADTLEGLAEREAQAAQALPHALSGCSISPHPREDRAGSPGHTSQRGPLV